MTAVEWLEMQFEESHSYINEIFKETFEQAKEMEKEQSFANVNRVEVIQHSKPYNGRAYTNYNAKDVKIQLQDNNKTLKIFLK